MSLCKYIVNINNRLNLEFERDYGGRLTTLVHMSSTRVDLSVWSINSDHVVVWEEYLNCKSIGGTNSSKRHQLFASILCKKTKKIKKKEVLTGQNYFCEISADIWTHYFHFHDFEWVLLYLYYHYNTAALSHHSSLLIDQIN